MRTLFSILVIAAVLLLWATIACTRHIRRRLRQASASRPNSVPGRAQLQRSAIKTHA